MSVNADESSIGEQLPWLPDETLFSWCSRYHVRSVNGLASATCLQLYGQRRMGVAHDLPSGVASLANRANGSLGTTEQIVRDRTLLPFYFPFRPAELSFDAMQRLAAGGIAHLKYRLGIMTSGLGAAHPLKACRACMDEDRLRHSVAYWHRAHQLPAVWVCPIHKLSLVVSPMKVDQRARFQWMLPNQSELISWNLRPGTHSQAAASRMHERMAIFGLSLVKEVPGRLSNPTALAALLRLGLARNGWLKRSRCVHWSAMEGPLARQLAWISQLPPFALQLDSATAKSQLSRIASARSLTHPLRYVSWFAWLFETWSELIAAYDAGIADAAARKRLSTSPSPGSASDPISNTRAQEAVAALLTGHESVTAIARRLGVTPSTIAAWAAKAGLSTPRRPKVLSEDRWQRAIAMLSAGRSKSAVATHCEVAEVSITRLLRSVPGLQQRWHQAQLDERRDSARTAWSHALKIARTLGITAARKLEPAAYVWLYRHDRSWLNDQCSRLPSRPPPGNHATARMRQADTRYAKELEALIAAAHDGDPAGLSDQMIAAIRAPAMNKVLQDPGAWPLTVAVLRSMRDGGRKRKSVPLL